MVNSQVSKFKKIVSIFRVLAIVFIVSSFFIPFATGLKMTVKSSSGNIVTTYRNAYSFIFGGKLVSEHVTYTAKSGSALGIIGFAFMFLSLATMIASLFVSKKYKLYKFFVLVGLIAALVSSIIFFCIHSSASSVLADAITGNASDAVKNTIYKNTSLSFGFIGTAVFELMSSLLLLSSFFFDGTIDKMRLAIGTRIGL